MEMSSLVAYEDSESEDEIFDKRAQATSAPEPTLSHTQNQQVPVSNHSKILAGHRGSASDWTVLGHQVDIPGRRSHFHLQNCSGGVRKCSVGTSEEFSVTKEKNALLPASLYTSQVSNLAKRHSSISSDVRPYIPKRQRLVSSMQTVDLQHPAQHASENHTAKNQNPSEVSTSQKLSINEQPFTAEVPRRLLMCLEGHQGPVNTMQWGPRPHLSHLLLSASMDKTFKVWDGAESGRCLRVYTCHSAAVRAACWTPCAQRLLSGSFDNTAVITDVETGRSTVRVDAQFRVTCVAFHPSSPEVFLCGGHSPAVKAWDARSCKVVNVYKAGIQQTLDILFLRGGAEFITSSDCVSRDSADRTLMAWDFQTTAKVSNQIYHERYTCPSLDCHPLEDCFVAQTNGNYMAVFSSQRPYPMNKRRQFQGHKVEGYAVRCGFSADGTILATGSSTGLAHFYDYHSGRMLHTLHAHSQPCLCVSQHPFLPTSVATCSWTGEIKVWH